MLRRRSVFVVFAIAALAAGVLSGTGVRQGVIVPLAGVLVDTVRPEAAVSYGR